MAIQEFSHSWEQKGGQEGGDSVGVGERCLAIGLNPIDGKKGGHFLGDWVEIEADQVRLTGASPDHAETGSRKDDPAKEKPLVERSEQPAA